ncbi:MAG: UDP-N-acetylmuramoyl-tripeptide--D-alanyl-D-alanine ligase [Chloroflexi bacterium]|nr:UDP-N-acetylmuramoyl-tripeptide--D-alanyl-D-alanine ligase [Chloroflexota bacterium]MQC26516.1 UDP-N-acetylmuramoyl-tripeptide--D-alanyl-D-alanine ligase [Chloroflexota bacterium]
MIAIADVIEALGSERPAWGTQKLTGAALDSREIKPGMLFVALKGEHVDGHDFVAQAFENGAHVALVERPINAGFTELDLRAKVDANNVISLPLVVVVENSLEALQKLARFWRNKLDLRVVGITGSVGKTTSKELIAEVLAQRSKTFRSIGNYNNEIGLPLNILNIDERDKYAVLEMGFYVIGEIAFLVEIAQPQIGVVTNIGTVHAERAGSQEAIYEGKAELVRGLPKDGMAILNYDDPLVRRMAEESAAPVFFYGLSPEADLWADEIEGLGLDGVRFQLHYKKEVLHVRVPMIGRHSVHTALRAAAVGLAERMDWQQILQGLRIGHAQLRLVAAQAQNGAILLDDTYNASPESAVAALNLLDELEGRKVAVLGDMLELGQYERQGHQMVGNLAAKVADLLITIGPRARVIAESARLAGMAADQVVEYEESKSALEFLKQHLSGEDIVLVKGSRAMHMDNIVPELEAGE